MLSTIGLIQLPNYTQTIIELAIERYDPTIIKKDNFYLANHINEICTKNKPEFIDSYSTRSQGYYNLLYILNLIDVSNTEAAKKIKNNVYDIYNENTNNNGDFKDYVLADNSDYYYDVDDIDSNHAEYYADEYFDEHESEQNNSEDSESEDKIDDSDETSLNSYCLIS